MLGLNKEEAKKENLKKIPVSEESAKQQLDDLLQYYDYEGVEDLLSTQSQKDREIFEGSIRSLLRHIKKGTFSFSVVDGQLEVIQILKSGSSLKWDEMDGNYKKKMKSDNKFEAVYQLIASLTNMSENAIGKLKPYDLSPAEDLGTIFLLL